ncbi:MAG: bifunctional methylenetetrahydrofolate dehydrogenase/methenyltetrahydrofolate cyclohydrolase FolD [Promethearchaeota archaeon]|nr:MAG: bifunctional methylenetetrahydrofolate dehydrogenase/methenyltetrahydrofolate cyclohydrolase FolD [Candidatus Lokiarchaeota archaeon]
MTIILDGKKLAEKLKEELKYQVESLLQKGYKPPTLATILVGDDPASEIYVRLKHTACKYIGIESIMISIPKDVSVDVVQNRIDELNANKNVHGILLQIPLPEHLSKYESQLIQRISPEKDVDGFNNQNRGRLFEYDEELAACTPKGIITLLEHYSIDIAGKDVTIINRSNLVGKPLIFMFLKRNGTVTICHTKTKDIDRYIKNADILVVAVGIPNFITQDKIKENVVIVDVGTNRIEGKLCGDVDYEDVLDKVKAITPSPGGVGPMTIYSLMENTITVYKKHMGIE